MGIFSKGLSMRSIYALGAHRMMNKTFIKIMLFLTKNNDNLNTNIIVYFYERCDFHVNKSSAGSEI